MKTTAVVRRCLSELTDHPAPPSDAELLARYVGRGDRPRSPSGSQADGRGAGDDSEAAFTELVRRHGPVVLTVCRRVLGPTPD